MSTAEVEFLREEGYSDADIEKELGVVLTPRKATAAQEKPQRRASVQRDRGEDERLARSQPLKGPLKRPKRDFRTISGDKLARPDQSERLMSMLEELALGEGDAEVRRGLGRGAFKAPDTRRLTMSRAGKIRRLAEAMVRLRGGDWAQVGGEKQGGFLRLAAFVMDALELVEDDEALIAAARKEERIERSAP